MRTRVSGALVAASIILLGGIGPVVAEELPDHERFIDRSTIIANTVSINPTECFILGDGGAAVGGDGRVFVKFDTKGRISTVTGKCNITGFEQGDLSGVFPTEDFPCVVHLNGAGNDGLGHDLLECIDPEDPDATTSLRLHGDKATLSCAGTYLGNVNDVSYTSGNCSILFPVPAPE